MSKTTMGFECYLAYGAAGSTASTQILYATDVEYTLDIEKGETTYRGDGSAPPIVYERTTARKPQLTFKMVRKQSDTVVAALIAAAVAGTPLAFRMKDYSSGLGPDMDGNVSYKMGSPMKGEQTVEFTITANDDNRVALLNV